MDEEQLIYNKDCRKMPELPDESIQLVVTSPPYWGMRLYEGQQDIIWSDDNCKHKWTNCPKSHDPGLHSGSNLGSKQLIGKDRKRTRAGSFCFKCGCWKGAFGLEPTPSLYVQHTIEILKEIRRVLRKDGVVFWNIGDTYITGKGSCFNPGGGTKSWKSYNNKRSIYPTGRSAPNRMFTDIPGKNLALIPFRIALAAQEDGWIIRQVVIWNKTNSKPESVKDRPTLSHEYILLMTKGKRYYWDHEAALIPYREPLNRWGGLIMKSDTDKLAAYREMQKIGVSSAFQPGGSSRPNPKGKNIRSVWHLPTRAYHGIHFAVFPEAIPENCIKIASKPGDTVLDCFLGTGTTLIVAAKLGRKGIGYDISEDYCQLARERLKNNGYFGGRID